jgi:DNA-binding FadR family transcriptional regulator
VSVETRTPAYQLLADEIRAQITSGRLRPGDRLPTEPQLCADTGVSRSTVREALRLLASQNLIVTTRGVSGGSFVAHPTATQLADALATGVHLLLANSVVEFADLREVREMLEVPVARLAAERRTDEHLVRLRATLRDAYTADIEDVFQAHGEFHMIVTEASGNSVLEVVMRPLYQLSNTRTLGEAAGRELWARFNAEHEAILEAIERRDADAAEAAAATHLSQIAVATHLMAPRFRAQHQAERVQDEAGFRADAFAALVAEDEITAGDGA